MVGDVRSPGTERGGAHRRRRVHRRTANRSRARRPSRNGAQPTYSFRFPAQDFKLRLGDRPRIAETLEPAGEIVGLDEDAFEISLRRSTVKGPLPHALSLIPAGPVGDKVLRAAVARYAEAVRDGREERYAAVTGILRRDRPRFRGRAAIGDDVARAIDAVGRLDRSHLVIQGPPGAGKTYAASRAIVEMLARAKRIGVSSHSHKAINVLLRAVEAAAAERGLRFRGVKKSSFEEQYLNGSIIEDTTDNDYAAAGGHDLIAGTAWLFAREELDRQLDYLFVDEAGQVSLANTLAMGVSARNVVLVGDQMQLSQPLQGSHPGRSGLSALEHLLDGVATVPPERGIFLSRTHRMHPDLCRFVSDAFYDGRLLPEASTERQRLLLAADADPGLAPTGLRFIEVEHDGCAQKSAPEAERIRRLYLSLLAQRWTDRDGRTRPIGVDDILVVGPVQHAGEFAALPLAGGCPRRHRRQVPGPGGCGRADLDGDLVGRRPAAADRVPVFAQPAQCRGLAGALSRCHRRLAAPLGGVVLDDRATAAGQRPLLGQKFRGRVCLAIGARPCRP